MAADYGASLGDIDLTGSGSGLTSGTGGSGSYSYGQNPYTSQPLISQSMLGTIGNDPYSGMPSDSYSGTGNSSNSQALAAGLQSEEGDSSTSLPNLQTNTSVDPQLMANVAAAIQNIGQDVPDAPYHPAYAGAFAPSAGGNVDAADQGDQAQTAAMMATGALQNMNPAYLSMMGMR